MSYFNTTNESGATLKNNVVKAKSQEIKLLKMFEQFNNKATPSDFMLYFDYPITSIRRALTNLTKQGKLIKTNEKRIGIYGRSEYVWKLNENINESPEPRINIHKFNESDYDDRGYFMK